MKSITLDATVENIAAVTDFVNEELEKADCPLKIQMKVDLVIDEAFSNIALYAYPEGAVGQATVELGVAEEDRTLTLRFTDSGVPYNPLEKEDPDVTLSAQDREIGGLGIFLIKKNMDEVFYERSQNKNILTLKKRLI